MVAAAQPACTPGDVAVNVEVHVRAVHKAQARVVVFPELSLTGYLMAARPLAVGDAVLEPLVAACAATGAVALVGAPVSDGADGKSIACWPSAMAGPRSSTARPSWAGWSRLTSPPGTGLLRWRWTAGGSVSECAKDTGTAAHISATAALGVDVYAAGLLHAPDELIEQDSRGLRIAQACAAHVIFASAAGEAGGPYERTAGTSTVGAADGAVLARAGAEPGEVACAVGV